MENRVYLKEAYFAEKESVVLENASLSASIFKYSTGVSAVRLTNARGNLVVLPYMGQMVWRCEFDGRELTMKSIYDEPMPAVHVYGETYGGFLMHCGLMAMGNPTAEDTHLPHGELPIAKYQTVYLVSGEDARGAYIGIGGVYSHKRCFEQNYDFVPLVKLYEDATALDVTVTFKNNKDVPLEYFYLCHINHRPVDGARLEYTAKRESIIVNHEVPENYFCAEDAAATNAYLDRLDSDKGLMDTVGGEGQAYMPEIVFCCFYDADEDGKAYTMQKNPDGTATYVIHRPEELPYGTRWIARTEDEDALGMVLPATAEHKGYLYCKAHGQERYLAKGDSVTYHLETGLLDKAAAAEMEKKIRKLGF